jgi:hypothetical protein
MRPSATAADIEKWSRKLTDIWKARDEMKIINGILATMYKVKEQLEIPSKNRKRFSSDTFRERELLYRNASRCPRSSWTGSNIP